MPDPTKQDAADKAKSQEQTFAEAAKRVQRKVVEFADVKGEDGKPAVVPPLTPETPEDKRRYAQAVQRRQLRRELEERYRAIKSES